MAVSHVKSNTLADWTGTVTIGNSTGGTQTIAATNLVRPGDWNSAHNQYYTLSGNTNNASTASGTNVVFQAAGGVTLAGSTATIVISAPAPVTYSGYAPYADHALVAGQLGQGTLQFEPKYLPNIHFDRLVPQITMSNASNSSGSQTVSIWFGLYTRNVSSLSLLMSTSTSTAVTQSGTVGSYSLHSGVRHLTIPWTTTITEGQYWIGALSRTTSGGANATFGNMLLSNINSNFVGHFGSSNNTTMQLTLGQGVYTATTSGMPGSVAFSQIRGSDSMAMRAPNLYFANSTI